MRNWVALVALLMLGACGQKSALEPVEGSSVDEVVGGIQGPVQHSTNRKDEKDG